MRVKARAVTLLGLESSYRRRMAVTSFETGQKGIDVYGIDELAHKQPHKSRFDIGEKFVEPAAILANSHAKAETGGQVSVRVYQSKSFAAESFERIVNCVKNVNR